MKNIILYTQNNTEPHYYESDINRQKNKLNALSIAAVEIAETVNAQAIIVETTSGATASRIASIRPNRAILSISDSVRTAQQLALSYANQSYIRSFSENSGYDLAIELNNSDRFNQNEELKFVIVSGRQKGIIGGTDTIQVRTI